jgi:hypothetical protein
MANPCVSVAALLAGWGEQTAIAAAGRHVLAIQDTSEINFPTTAERRRGLGEIGKGSGRGALLHAMLAVDAQQGSCLGLVTGEVWTRQGRVETPHSQRLLEAKESARWLETAERAKSVLAQAEMVTVIADRESDIYAEWALLPAANFHLLTRAMHDRSLVGGGKLSTAPLIAGGAATIEVRERPDRPARRATLTLRFGRVKLARPKNTIERGLPKSVEVTLVEVVELFPPPEAEPIHWRLLTTHQAPDAAAAWQIVAWYRVRWTIEQLYRTLKLQGFKIEDSQLDTADRLLKLIAIATKAACVIMQLVHARAGQTDQPASIAFTAAEITTLEALDTNLRGKTLKQQNPYPGHSLAWAAWIIAKLGGWDGYASSRPPGPITFRHGLEHFYAIHRGWRLRDV